MVPDAEAYRRREIGSKRSEEEMKKIQPLRPLGAADTDLEYLPAAKGGVIDMDRMRLELMNKGGVLPRKKRDAGLEKFLSDSQIKERLYHATPNDFSAFKLGGDKPAMSGRAVWLSADSRKQPASHNIHTGASNYKQGVNVMPVHVKAKNPLVLDDPTMIEWAREVFAGGSKEFPELLPPHWIDAVKKEGYDSIHFADPYGHGDPHEVIMFEPNKIKSAIGNRGTYDTTNPDITKAKGGSVKEPKNTVKAYKLFRVHPKHPGKLFPLFVNANEPVEMNKWVDAKEGEMAGDKVKSKIGPLAYRPGWHAGDLPVATHIGEKSDPNLTAPDVRPANHVWAEVEMPHDVDWQSVANERGMNPKGKLIARNAHITDQIPKGGHYRYKTNSNMTGNWLIGGAMKVNRVLQDKEVKAINKAAGAADLPRTRPFKAKDYGLAKGGVVAPEEFIAEEHVNYKAKDGKKIQHKWHGGPIVDSLVGTFPSLAPVANAIGATKVGLSEKELPTDDMYWYSNGATRDLIGNDRRGDVNPMLGVPLSTQPTDLPKSIKMYRADPTGKYGGKEGIETLPQPRFDVGGDRYHNKVEDPTVSDVYGDSSKAIQQLYRYARLNGAANKYGYPSLSPEDVAAMALKEGRSDLGFNAVNLGHPDELKFNKMLRDTYNLTSNDQNFLAALFAKQRVADKFNIPFANAWNGTGVNDAGQSGKDYAKNYEHHKKAALHPNNQQLMELVNRAIEDGKKHGLPLRENSIKDSMRHYIPVPYKKRGGRITHAHHLDIEERPL
jgi:hypothetical protein